eukprot:jgi/Mesen1/6970/ME000361S06120
MASPLINTSQNNVALIVGVTGIVGNHVLRRILSDKTDCWEKVYGVSRKPCPDWLAAAAAGDDRFVHVQADVGSASAAQDALVPLRHVTHVFYATWAMRPSEEESCQVNGAMLRNVLTALCPVAQVKHVTLTTGTKHYLGPFETYGKVEMETPYREDLPRLPGANFYYALEDALFEHAKLHGFTICQVSGMPFRFPGSRTQWEGLNEVSDADLVAEQEVWGAIDARAQNEAFNTTNGDLFRWKYMWPKIAKFWNLEPAPYEGPAPLQESMKDKGEVWDRLVAEHGLKPHKMDELAVWWHADADLSREIEAINDMTKSREAGFFGFRNSQRSFYSLFQYLRDNEYTL